MPDVLPEVSEREETQLASTYDELPLWAAPFGLKLLAAIEMKPHLTVLDVGSGTGFPLIEIAQRLGETCWTYGVDPWRHANIRVREKTRFHSIHNARVLEARAETLPFIDRCFDLIVSNNGINNADDPEAALKECARVAKPGGQMVLAMNLPETMIEFYYIYADTLAALGFQETISRMYEHILGRRPPVSHVRRRLEAAGFHVLRAEEDRFRMRFATGTALLHHSFLKLFFVDRWKGIVDSQKRKEVFDNLEHNLNAYADRYGSIDLSIPYVCLDCRRP